MRSEARWLLTAAGLALLAALVLSAGQQALVRSAPAWLQDAGGATQAAFTKGGCAACHAIPGVPNAVGVVGPDLSAIGVEAGQRVSGQSAEVYIRESILDPNAVIAPLCPLGECPSDVMPQNFGEKLSTGEIDLIVAHLLTLSGEAEFAPSTYELIPIEVVRPPETEITPFAEPPSSYEDAAVLLGKYLFFDPRLSGNATTSCASCHIPEQAWSDGLALSRGYPATAYFRNTPTVLNTGFLEYLYWDGRMDGSDMPTLVRDHLTEAHFMNTDGRLMVERVKQVPEYVQLFQDAWGSNPSFGRVLNSIRAYVHSLNSGASPYDTGNLSAQAAAGQALFEGAAGCAACHSGPTFSDNGFHATGVPQNPDIWNDPLRHITFRRFFRLFGTPNYRALEQDPGLYALTLNPDDWAAFRTSPLREVASTAPYMHNGALNTLEEVVRFYDQTQSLGLGDSEVAQLVAFLESLSSELPPVEAPQLPDYQLRPLGDNR